MYIKGTPPSVSDDPDAKSEVLGGAAEKSTDGGSVADADVDSVWNSHEDRVPVSSKG